MFGYSSELRGFTQGIGEYSMEYKTHKPVSFMDLDKIIESFQNKKNPSSDKEKKKSDR
jgi:elongation factor G